MGLRQAPDDLSSSLPLLLLLLPSAVLAQPSLCEPLTPPVENGATSNLSGSIASPLAATIMALVAAPAPPALPGAMALADTHDE
eukprot:4229105-Pyramimonas_sp.AAC.1